MGDPKKKHGLKGLLAVMVLWLLFVWLFWVILICSKGTNVAYQASDGHWADYEMLHKGRDFHMIVWSYERYKMLCERPDVTLQRITEKPNVFAITRWFDDFDAPKWKVPLVKQHAHLEGKLSHPSVFEKHCFNQPLNDEQLEQARERAEKYIRMLQKA